MKFIINWQRGSKVNLAGFYEESTANGQGFRAVIFVSGCTHHCKGCQNKEAWDFNYGEEFSEQKRKGVYEKIKENTALQGVTLSGGDPFQSAKGLITLVRDIKALGKDIWAYTGYTIEELVELNDPDVDELLRLTDVLVDGRFIEELLDYDLLFRGSSNQRIIDLNKLRAGNSLNESLWKDDFYD